MNKKPVTQVVRWVQNAPQSLKRSLSTSQANAPLNKQWVHPPDVLTTARVEYTVRFLGEVEVPEPKGTEVIKDAIQKIRFNLQLKRSAAGLSGSKLARVELQINVDGLRIVDVKSRAVLYNYPLHRISFCADDKQDKRVFSFIAKQADSARHNCFVFLSDKLAEEITLTIGEAFDLAYRKFLDNNGRDLENKKQVILLRKRISELEKENAALKEKLASCNRSEAAVMETPKWENFDSPPPQLPTSPVPRAPPAHPRPPTSSTQALMLDLTANGPVVGRNLENLQLNSMDDLFDDEFDPRAEEKSSGGKDPFGLDPFGAVQNGEGQPTAEELEDALLLIDSRLAEMREGFSRGLTVANEDLGGGLDFDPLLNRNPTPPSAN